MHKTYYLLFLITLLQFIIVSCNNEPALNEVIEIKSQKLEVVKMMIERENSKNSQFSNPKIKQIELSKMTTRIVNNSAHFFINKGEMENYFTNHKLPTYYTRKFQSTNLQPLQVILDKTSNPALRDHSWIKGILGGAGRPIEFLYNYLKINAVIPSNPFIITNQMNTGGELDSYLQAITNYYGTSKKIFIYDQSTNIMQDQLEFYFRIAKQVKYLFVQTYLTEFKTFKNIIWVPIEFNYAIVNKNSLLPLEARKYLYFHHASNSQNSEILVEYLKKTDPSRAFGVVVNQQVTDPKMLEVFYRNSMYSLCADFQCVLESLQFGSVPILLSLFKDQHSVAMPSIIVDSKTKLELILTSIMEDSNSIAKGFEQNWYFEFISSIQLRFQNLIDIALGDVELQIKS